MTSIIPPFEKLASPMRTALKIELENAIRIAKEHGSQEMHNMLAYQLGWIGEKAGPQAEGKQIRPLLVLLTAQAAGGAWESALPAAAAVELLHNFSLIHDDIEDNSDLRRGRPTVWKRWGLPQAVNAGDAMLTLANLAILRLTETTSPATALPATRILQETCLRLTQGQHLDMAFEERERVTVEEYWQMVQGKTAVLIASCCELGALCAQASDAVRDHYREFGYKLGLAFQAQDDLLGIWGKMEKIGKSNQGDLLSGKKTLPILYGLAQGGDFAARWDSGPLTADEIPAMAQTLEEEGARAYTQDATRPLTEQALSALRDAGHLGEAGAAGQAQLALRELAHKLIERKG